jgi:ribosomal protein S12 methylthiotransferase
MPWLMDGVRELNLVAQDITLFGTDSGGLSSNCRNLLSGLAELGDLTWIRLLYAYPERVDDKLIQIMATSEKVCKYLDLPLQHAADPVLQRMGRTTTGEKMLQLTERLRRDVPGITLRSTFIVGFPGEGENEFSLLLEFLEEAPWTE